MRSPYSWDLPDSWNLDGWDTDPWHDDSRRDVGDVPEPGGWRYVTDPDPDDDRFGTDIDIDADSAGHDGRDDLPVVSFDDGDGGDGGEGGGDDAGAIAPWWRRPSSLAAGVAVMVAMALVAAVTLAEDGDVDVAAADPDTGYSWCVSADSDLLDGQSGNGLGLEDGGPCRVRTPDADGPQTAAGDGEPEDGTVSPPTLPSPSAPGTSEAAAAEGGEGGGGEPAEGDGAGAGDGAGGGSLDLPPDYQANLDLIRAQTYRNTTQDDSPDLRTPSDQLTPEDHYGPRTDYLNNPAGNPEGSFPVEQGGQFRTGCEFSHFAYDDPLVFPGQPGASHLHMFFGNTDVNAYSTADSVLNSGGGTCNGQELNRTGYWAPALFDGAGNVRIPERIVVYYKGEGLANGRAEPFPEGAAMIASTDLNTVPGNAGGAAGKFSFTCSDQWSGASDPAANTIPDCDGSTFKKAYGVDDNPHVVLEMNVKFPQCWNGQDPSNPANFRHPSEGSWYFSLCEGEFNHTLVNLEYFIDYRVDVGERTGDWYLSSDVDPATRTLTGTGGTTNHADWWGGWHAGTNQMFLDNCVNYKTSAPSGCGFGYLTDGGPDGDHPKEGPALRYREQYTGPTKVPAAEVYADLCPSGAQPTATPVTAYCDPGSGITTTSGAPARTAGDTAAIFCPAVARNLDET